MKKTKMMKKNFEFKCVLSKGKYFSGRYIEAFIKKNIHNENCLGIAIGVKIAKAVRRNYIKRLVREVYRKFEYQIKDGYSIVFLWKKKANLDEATFANIKKDFLYIFDKACILEESNEKNND